MRDQKLSQQIIEEFHAAGQRGDLAAFKRLLGQHAAHVPSAIKDELIADFVEKAKLLQEALRKK
ncbi:MAG: hypothetical protein WBC78_18335 [Candidatus Sulfotelmatobacter sp.]